MTRDDRACRACEERDCFGEPGLPTPVALAPAPRQAALPYRVGDHGRFREAMLQGIAGRAALAGLTTRDPSDPAIALIDAWAVTLDVLTFFQERIANEGFLRTATERRSMLELAREIDYELAPGVAAGTFLAFSCDEMAGSPETVAIPAGTKVQSVPKGEQLPQTFETSEALVALPEFSDIRAETARYVAPAANDKQLYLEGVATGLRIGDRLLLLGDERRTSPASDVWQLRKVASLTAVPADLENRVPMHTIVELDEALGPDAQIPKQKPRLFALRERTNLFGFNAPEWKALPLSLRYAELRPELAAAGLFNRSEDSLLSTQSAMMISSGDAAKIAGDSAAGGGKRKKLANQGRVNEAEAMSLVSHIALDDLQLGMSLEEIAKQPLIPGHYATRESSWADAVFGSGRKYVDLDQVHDAFVAGGWVALRNETLARVYKVTAAVEVHAADYTLAHRVTRLTLTGPDLTPFSPRNATLFGVSELLPWGQRPVSEPVIGDTIVLLEPAPALTPGRLVAVTGTDAATGEAVARVLEIAEVSQTAAGGTAQMQDIPTLTTEVRFTTEIDRPLIPRTVRINANIARATHGETHEHVIGSGEASALFQSFKLPSKPVTHVSAPTPSGERSTLEVRVNGVLWQEAENFIEAGPSDRIFVTRRADDGSVTVQFGDGVTGARLPTGRGNVRARYRVGSGEVGLLAADQITQPLTRPLGLKAVTNPLPPTGARDPEGLVDARQNAPLTVRTMGRIVSLADIEDFARRFAGVGKARVAIIWNGFRRVVQLTVAGTDGAELGPLDALYDNLLEAMALVRHADRPIRVDGHVERGFEVTGKVKVASGYLAADVIAAAGAALADSFSFGRRGFAQPVSASELLAILHAIPGVTAVFLEELKRSDGGAGVASILEAKPARFENGVFQRTELLLLAAGGTSLTEASA
jgi:hypothetical protein